MPAVTFLLLSAAKATVLIGAALLVLRLMRRGSAATRHAILVAAMIAALLVPLLAATLPTLSPVPAAPSNPQLQLWSDNVVRLFLEQAEPESHLPLSANARTRVEEWGSVTLAFWLTATAFIIARIAADLAAARRSRRRARLRGRLSSGVSVLESAEIEVPVVVGIFHPVIMLPCGSTLDAASLQPMITHELAHIVRRDCLTQLIVRVVCAIYWFNPLAWVAARQVALEREEACDDHALASGVDPIDYSQILIDVARRYSRTTLRVHAAPLIPHKAHLEQRVVRILDASTSRAGLSRARLLAVTCAAAVVVAPLAALGVRDRPSAVDQSDAYFDPQSERVPGHRTFDRTPPAIDAATPDEALVAALLPHAAREPRSQYDLVPDRALWVLSMVRDGKVIEPLIHALGHSDWRVQGYAAWALAIAGDDRANEPLCALLDRPVWRVRAAAASALRELGNERAANKMEKALDDPAWQVRIEAVAFFGEHPGLVPAGRIEALRNDPHIAVRLAADEALERIE